MIIKSSKTACGREKLRCMICLLEIIMLVCLVIGCQSTNKGKADIVFTTGLNRKELFKIGNEKCKISEANILLFTMQRQYEKLFGKDNWNQKFSDGTIGDYVKQQVVTQLSQIKIMNLMAVKKDITLSREEKENAAAAAKEYNEAFSDTQRKEMDINKTEVDNLFQQYALANKLYSELVKNVNTEVSDDEARIIRIQQILFKTYKEEDKKKLKITEEERNALNQKAYQVWERAKAGEDFGKLAAEFNDDSITQYTIGRGEMPDAFEEAAFNLKNNEISQIVETDYGLHIIKCISNYEQSETDEHKKTIYEQRCSNQFNKKYDAFMQTVPVEFNHKAWDKVILASSEDIPEVDFFELYNRHFKTR